MSTVGGRGGTVIHEPGTEEFADIGAAMESQANEPAGPSPDWSKIKFPGPRVSMKRWGFPVPGKGASRKIIRQSTMSPFESVATWIPQRVELDGLRVSTPSTKENESNANVMSVRGSPGDSGPETVMPPVTRSPTVHGGSAKVNGSPV